MRTISNLLLLAVLAAVPHDVTPQTNYCCNMPNFGSDWCHSSSCLGAGCRNEPDPITGQSQSNYLCDDLSSCVCAGIPPWKTMSFCTVKKSCANAKVGVKKGAEAATVLLQGTPTQQCLDAITTAVCAYHFPRCEDDDKRFTTVCYDTCNTLKEECGGLLLDKIVLVQGRCQSPPPADGTVVIGRDKCTASAPSLIMHVVFAAAPLLLVMAA